MPHVVQAVDLFLHPEWARHAGRGRSGWWRSRLRGCPLADHGIGKHVSMVEMLPYFMKGVCTANRGHMIHDLERRGELQLHPSQIHHYRRDHHCSQHFLDGTGPLYHLDSVAAENIRNPLAHRSAKRSSNRPSKPTWSSGQGLRADHSLFEACQAQNTAGEIFVIGDNFRIGRVFEAVEAGFTIGNSL